MTPLAQAALAESQNTATMTVKQKSIMGAFFDSAMYISEAKTYTPKMAMVDKNERTPVKTKNWASDEKSPGRYMLRIVDPQLTFLAGT